jgi:hypothetical protein
MTQEEVEANGDQQARMFSLLPPLMLANGGSSSCSFGAQLNAVKELSGSNRSPVVVVSEA